MNNQGEYERLLKNRVREDLFLDRDLHFDSLGMRFSPEEVGSD